MDRKRRWLNRWAFPSACIALALIAGPRVATADAVIVFDTELMSLNLSGGPYAMPLASDPGNALGDSIDGFGFVNSNILITLSSQRAIDPGPASLGQAHAFEGIQEANGGGLPPIDPGALDGKLFRVQSFFDVFFDITITDVDDRPGRDFATGTSTINIQDIGPANMQSFYAAVFDKDAPNFGLVPPPEAAPYIGHFNIVLDLSAIFNTTVDINMNGDPDVLKFTLATHAVGDENRTFITLPDGTVIDNFDSTANLEGAIVDSSSDPPFTMGGMSGPTTASSRLLNQVVPEPSTLVLAAAGMAAVLAYQMRRRQSHAA